MRRSNLAGLLLVLALLCGFAAPATAAPAAQTNVELTVFAAASLTEAFKEIGGNFERANPGVKVVFNFAGSQQLAAQLAQGAPADVFASANITQMNNAIKARRVVEGSANIFVQNKLVVVTPRDGKVKITKLQDLARPGLKVVLADKAVPVGQYSLEYLDKASKDPAFGSDYRTKVLANVVSYEDNVRSVLTKVALGEADAGIVYVSDVISAAKNPVRRLDIPARLNVIASYPIAPIGDAPQAQLAAKFVRFMFNGQSQLILVKYGFSLPS